MNITSNIISFGSVLVAALAIGAWQPAQTQAADAGSARGGGAKLQELTQIKTQAEAEALKPGDSIAMVCSKCKSVIVQRVGTERGHLRTMTPGEKHLCPGCSTTIEVVGVQKGAHGEVKHVCKACGDTSAFCCATKPASATKGMEK